MKLLVRLAVAFVAIASSAAFAAKPAPPPPPPPSGCVGFGGTFPSVVFGKSVRTANGTVSSWDIYVGNSLGDCAVKVFSIAGVQANNVSMAFNSSQSQYRIVWTQAQSVSKNGPYRAVVKMVHFAVAANHSIVEPLPLAASTLYTDQSDTTAAYIYDASISSDGNLIVFARQASTELKLELLDISACSSACANVDAFTGTPYEGVSGATFGAGSDGPNRIFFTAKKAGVAQSWGLYFIAKNDGWPQTTPILVASMADTLYEDPARKIYFPRATRVPVNPTPDHPFDELVSFSAFTRDPLSQVSIKGVDVIDVENCASSDTVSCLENNKAYRLGYNISGEVGSGGWKGDGSMLLQKLLPQNYNYELQAIDPFGLDLLDYHSEGQMPDGIK